MQHPSGRLRALTLSGLVIAAYCVIMYFTQSFAFGAYQVRLATGLYSLSYLMPFLVAPLGLANMLANVLGGMGIYDILGGGLAGVATSGAVWLVGRLGLPRVLIIPIIILGPGLLVPIWLAPILNLPYGPLALSLCIGQAPPAVLGYLLVRALGRIPALGDNHHKGGGRHG